MSTNESIIQPRIFIHIPRNAGLTIRKSSSLYDLIIDAEPAHHKDKNYTDELRSQMESTGDEYGYYHARWRDLNSAITSLYVPFAIIRNPWDRAISQYMLAKKMIEVDKSKPKNYANVSSFEAFLDERHKWKDIDYMWHSPVRSWYQQVDYVTNADGEIQCDCLRYEDLNEIIKKYFRVKEISAKRNVTNMLNKDWKLMYNGKTQQIVADWYEKDIDTFGFDFDTPAQKNYWSSIL